MISTFSDGKAVTPAPLSDWEKLYIHLRRSDFSLYVEETVWKSVSFSEKSFSDLFKQAFAAHLVNSSHLPIEARESSFPKTLINKLVDWLYPAWKSGACYGKQIARFRDKDLVDRAYSDAFVQLSKALERKQFQRVNNAQLETYFCKIFERSCMSMVDAMDGHRSLDEIEIPTIISTTEFTEAREAILREAGKYIGGQCLDWLMLHHVDGYPHKEIMAILKVEVATPPNRLASNCRRKFRLYFCERPWLLSEMGLETVKTLFEQRKDALAKIAERLSADCVQALKLDNPCLFDDSKIQITRNDSTHCGQLLDALIREQPEWEKLWRNAPVDNKSTKEKDNE